MADLIYFYISKGQKNSFLTFSQFLYFCREIQLSTVHVNQLVYKMIANRKQWLDLVALFRIYVNTEKGSIFAKEVEVLIQHCVDMIEE